MNIPPTARRGKAPLALTAALLLAVSACGGDSDASSNSGSGSEDLSGSVRVDGSSTVAPLTTAAAEIFAEEQPRVRVTVGTSGTGGGFEKFCNGETDISDASRPIDDEEKKACDSKGVEYREFVVANDALTVVVPKSNDWVECLTTRQLKQIWDEGSQVDNWNEIDPKFPDEPLKLFGPGTDSGTFDYFTDEINGEEGRSRTDYSPSEDDNVIVQGVAGSPGGLGYFGFTYYEENTDKLKALKIDSGGGCVAPSVKAAQDGTYTPLARPLYLYPSVEAAGRPEVMGFLEFYVDNHKSIAEDAQFIPLNSEQESRLKTALDDLKAAAG
ncbi:PstS family phosphate ABC transporter substrate-binding protein [Streptomyces sp. CA-210063]|uniref:PstS family phosphate ABC transporter substrate-binding protein n=1 Tax=Streptomyces sp. CA-210063 TaxID=2801029 RepID=UPI00214B0561|nr:PstS family phosphate ABC transporter substrate-binding protein [Streptomyces sp. CA-210063]UUU32341.1 PstS family phosphate ABC transporter substrate-binding protein [Streptomyces sp. CA-210063]